MILPRPFPIARNLPPLNALRAFEAAARHGGYVGAAAELGTSSAAVSQQVRKLEDFLGSQVFERRNNGVALTDAGQALFASAREALDIVGEATRRQGARRPERPLVLSAIGSIAEKWLAPRLVAYVQAHGDFRFDLRVEPDPVALGEGGPDLRLGYDPAHYPGLAVTVLARDAVLPVCSPAFLEAHPGLRAQGMVAAEGGWLVHGNWGPAFASLPGWDDWFAAAGIAPPAGTPAYRVGNSGAALDLARLGLGVALGQRMMAEADLAAGRLVALADVAVPVGHPYCLAWRPERAHRAHLAGLVAWLTKENQGQEQD